MDLNLVSSTNSVENDILYLCDLWLTIDLEYQSSRKFKISHLLYDANLDQDVQYVALLREGTVYTDIRLYAYGCRFSLENTGDVDMVFDFGLL
jgi:hypothetical protein